ncbi:MAG: hypothetical protein NT116_05670 [Candidatus Parcubacteria bacterium]|nr:hypothetical protein [Candidatus Parcubacteria bacterium]
MEKCRIFLFGTCPNDEEINEFLSDGKEVTRVLQSSAVWADLKGQPCIATHLTIFYKV